MQPSDDFLAGLDAALDTARAEAAAVVDRCEALVVLRSLALKVAAELGRPSVTASDVFDYPRDEQARARLQAVTDRIITNERTH